MSFLAPSHQVMLTADALDDLRGLARALVLGDRFSFHLVVAASPGATKAAFDLLEKDEALVRKGLVIERHRPDLTTAPGLALAPAMATPRDRGVLVDLSFVVSDESEAFEAICAHLNATRNAWAQSREAPLLVCVPDFAEGLFARTAPDLWSIRSSVSRLTVRPTMPEWGLADDWRSAWLDSARTLEKETKQRESATALDDAEIAFESNRERAQVLAKTDLTRAVELIDELVEDLRRATNLSPYLLPRALETRALVHMRAGNIDEASVSALEAVALREAVRAPARRLETALSLALAADLSLQRRRFPEAESLARRSLAWFDRSSSIDELFLSVPVWEILNSALVGKEDLSAAQEAARQRVRRCAEEHRKHPTDRRATFSLAASLLSLGLAEKNMRRFSDASDRIVRASRLFATLGPQASAGVEISRRLLAGIDSLRGDFDRARPELLRQVEMSTERARAGTASLDDLVAAAVATRDLGIVDLQRGAVDDGRRTLEESLSLFREVERIDGPSMAHVSALAVLAASYEDNPPEALRLLDEAFELARKRGSPSEVVEMLNEIRSKALAALPPSDSEPPADG